jgi:Ca2+/H+ antiporter
VDGLIYVAIIALWAVFLVGQLLRHHDDVAESRSADRFSTAMRVLARRSVPAPDRRYIVKPPAPATASGPVERETFVKGIRAPRPSRVRMLARRRRILFVLLALIGVTAAAGGLGWMPLWSAAAPVLLLVAYVGYLRRQVRRVASISRRQAAAARSAEARRARMEHLDRLRAAREGRDGRRTGSRVLDGHLVDDTQVAGDQPDEGWNPRPLPLPTYVTAPPAPPGGSTRVIDLTSPGAWSEGLAPERIDAREAELPEEEPDQIVPRRYVVND